jgi:hypothetical protein
VEHPPEPEQGQLEMTHLDTRHSGVSVSRNGVFDSHRECEFNWQAYPDKSIILVSIPIQQHNSIPIVRCHFLGTNGDLSIFLIIVPNHRWIYPIGSLSLFSGIVSMRSAYRMSSSTSRCLNDNTIRQAPHYYEPYFAYLSSRIMSYALHVELDNDLFHITLRVTI